MITTFTVTGMTCSHCVSAVTEEVSKIDNVTNVEVDLASGAVTVESDGRRQRRVRGGGRRSRLRSQRPDMKLTQPPLGQKSISIPPTRSVRVRECVGSGAMSMPRTHEVAIRPQKFRIDVSPVHGSRCAIHPGLWTSCCYPAITLVPSSIIPRT